VTGTPDEEQAELPPAPPVVAVHPGPAGLAAAAAARIADLLAAAVAARGTASIALAGGSTPQPAYAALAAEPLRSRVPWPAVEVFWGDERAVPPDHEASNFRLADEALLSRVPVAPERVHRMRGELEPARAARLYEEELILALGAGSPDGAPPRLDVVLLGLGADGHTASLFPAGFAGHQDDAAFDPHPGRLASPAEAPDEPRRRVTLTLSCLAAARHVLFLVSGAGKAEAVARSLAAGPPLTPAARVRPWDGQVTWLLDRAAAGGGPSVSVPLGLSR
jgi:6-phosphogluconolactonase